MLEVGVLPSHFAALALERRMEASDGRNNQSPTHSPFPWAPSQPGVHLPACSDPTALVVPRGWSENAPTPVPLTLSSHGHLQKLHGIGGTATSGRPWANC